MSEDVLYVARNLRASAETQALGEDAVVVKAIAESFRALQTSVEAARFLVRSKAASDMLTELETSLADLWHDASVGVCMVAANEAADEAKVVPIRRPQAPKLELVK